MQFTTTGYVVNAAPGGSIALVGAATNRTDPGTFTTLNAPLTGAGSLTKLDTGTLTLGGNRTYTGSTTVADGLGLGTGPMKVLNTATSSLNFSLGASAGAVTITNVAAGSASASVSRSSSTGPPPLCEHR